MKLYISLAYVAALLSSCGQANITTRQDSATRTTTIDSATASGATENLVATHRFSIKGTPRSFILTVPKNYFSISVTF